MNNDTHDHSAGGTFVYDKAGKLQKHEPPSKPRDDSAIQPAFSPKTASKPKARRVVAQKASVPTKVSAPIAADTSSSAAE